MYVEKEKQKNVLGGQKNILERHKKFYKQKEVHPKT